MNRIFIALVLAFGLSLTTLSTIEAETVPGPIADASDVAESEAELNKAIRLRQINYLLNLKRAHSGKTHQLAEHNYSLFQRNVDTVQTKLNREGELQNTENKRHFSNPSIAAPNTPKRNFKVRAIDYFVEGGDAGKEVLENNVIISSQHSARRSIGQNLSLIHI